MAHRFNIRTERGRPDSLRRPTRIAFTLTPAESRRPTRSYDTLAFHCMSFDSNHDHSRWLEWDLDLGFGTYEALDWSGIRRYCCFEAGPSFRGASPGQIIPLTSAGGLHETQWGHPEAYEDHIAFKQFSIMAVNVTESEQQIALGTRVTHDYTDGATNRFEPIAAYHPLESGGRIITPSDLVLQAYVVENAVYYDGSILLPEDMTRPLFPVPLKCDDLPPFSIWKLCQDRSGNIRLENEDQAVERRAGPAAIEVLAQSIGDMAIQLFRLEQSMNDSQERLDGFDKLITNNRVDIFSSMDSIATIRSELDRRLPEAEARATAMPEDMSGETARRLAALEARQGAGSRTLEGASHQLEGRLAAVEGFVTQAREDITSGQQALLGVRTQLSDMEQSVVAIRTDMTAVQGSILDNQKNLTGLDRKIPLIEQEVEALKGSSTLTKGEMSEIQKAIDATKGQLATMKTSVDQTRRKLSVVDASVTGARNQTSQDATRRISAVEAKTAALEESSGRMQELLTATQESVGLARNRLDGLDQVVMAVGTKADTHLELATRNQDRLSAVEKAVGETKQVVARVETSVTQSGDRLSTAEKDVGETKQLLAGLETTVGATRNRLVDVERRIPALETKAEDLATASYQSRDRINAVESSRLTKDQFSILQESINKTQGGLDIVKQTVTQTGKELSAVRESVQAVERRVADVDKRLPKIEAKTKELGTALDDRATALRKSIVGVEERVVEVRQLVAATRTELTEVGKATQLRVDIAAVGDSLATTRAQVAASERKADALSRTLNEAVDNLGVVQKGLTTAQEQVAELKQKVPAVEAKAEQLAESFGNSKVNLEAVRKSVDAAEARLVTMDQKVARVETSVEKLTKDFEGDVTPNGSPGMFPDRSLAGGSVGTAASPDRGPVVRPLDSPITTPLPRLSNHREGGNSMQGEYFDPSGRQQHDSLRALGLSFDDR